MGAVVDSLGAFVLILVGLWSLSQGDGTRAIACLGWACALHNRTMINELRRRVDTPDPNR